MVFYNKNNIKCSRFRSSQLCFHPEQKIPKIKKTEILLAKVKFLDGFSRATKSKFIRQL